MNKQEFLNKLRSALGGLIPADQVEDTIRYYEDYINTQMRLGKTESQVLAELGDPRLIARSISDVYKAEHDGKSADQAEKHSSFTQNAGRQGNYGYENAGWNNQQGVAGFAGPDMGSGSVLGKVIRMPGWLVALIAGLIVLLFLVIVFSILSFLAPFILIGLVIAFCVKLFRDWLN